jgi:hypothetical protein
LFEHDHGLAATEPGWEDGDQHDYPSGWAYSHWYVTQGLIRFGYRDAAVRIALKWLRLVAGKLHQFGVIFERYNVVDPDGPTPGRYPPQRGFGWTNGVFAALLTRVVLGLYAGGPEPTGGRNDHDVAPLTRRWRRTPIGSTPPPIQFRRSEQWSKRHSLDLACCLGAADEGASVV